MSRKLQASSFKLQVASFRLEVFIACSVWLATCSNFGFAQEPAVVREAEPQTQVSQITEPEMLWLWGEVAAVDPEKKVITVKSLDFETDAEKEIGLNVDDAAMYDNVDSVSGLKVKDTVSIDYIISADGQYIAKVISLEKIDEILEASEPAPVIE